MKGDVSDSVAVKKRYWFKTVISVLVVLCFMPLGHAMMIMMEHLLPPSALHYCAFALGAVGLAIVIAGVFVKGDTRQTLLGLIGGLLFWTGWVEFLFQYYANRYGVQPEIVNGEIVTKPEYLILPATFGMWMLIMTVYVFSVKTGCYCINWLQKLFFGKRKDEIVTRPLSRHTSITTFMELNMMMWACYLLLMFCYDSRFLGDSHPVTFLVGIQYPHGDCYRNSVLDSCGNHGQERPVQRDMGGPSGARCRDGHHTCRLHHPRGRPRLECPEEEKMIGAGVGGSVLVYRRWWVGVGLPMAADRCWLV